jgi:Domain of unknown function (DUF4440)
LIVTTLLTRPPNRAALLFRLTMVGVLASCFAGTGCTIWRARKPTTWSAATAPNQFENILWKDLVAGNVEEVHRHLAPLFVFTSADGTRDREAYLQYLAQMHISGYSMADVTSKPNGNDWVVSYRLTLQGTALQLPTPARVMTVWQHVRRSWVVIAQSVTPEVQPTTARP